jgi:aminoglycoside 3-N-acetyltransferase
MSSYVSTTRAGAHDDSAARLTSTAGRNDLSRPPRPALSSQDLAADLRTLGVTAGQTLLVHSSLRSIGWVDGGAESVVSALREVLGPAGTLVVPTGTADNSDSSRLYLARIARMSEQEAERFRAEMRPFDRDTTPSTGMGRIAEAVRTHPEARRSDHPQTSFAALGPMADDLMADHELTCHLGEDSPIGKMYCIGASVLLLGVSFSSCSALHLAEYLYTLKPPVRTYSCVMKSDSGRRWVSYEDVVLDDSDFRTLGIHLDESKIPDHGRVGNADCRLMSLCSIVDSAAGWMQEHRSVPSV